MHFEPDFSFARMPDGSELTFTRSEARALAALVSSEGRVLSRTQLLDAVSEEGSEKNDRVIDFLINRVRRKLGDSARDPKFIATRYGEGYVWLGTGAQVVPTAREADVVISPVRGLAELSAWSPLASDLRASLQRAFMADKGADSLVRLGDQGESFNHQGEVGRDLTIELSLFEDFGNVECIVSAKLTRTDAICFVERLQLGNEPRAVRNLDPDIRRMVPLMRAKSWAAKTEVHGQTQPLPVAMHEASDRKDEHELSWRENNTRLITLRREKPDDPSVKLMYATHLHSKYVTLGFELFRTGEANCAVDEAEIERLVLDALDFAQTRPEHAVMAAKLLYFVDQGYKDLALDLTDNALGSSTNIASTLAMAGQLKGFLGDGDAAIHYIRQALALSKKGSTFYHYALVLLCQSLMALNRFDELAEPRSELYADAGLRSVFFEPIFADPHAPSLRAKAVALMLSRQRARGILMNLFYVSGRLFVSEEQRENSMRTPVSLFVRRFGPSILTDEMKASMPNMLG